MEKITQKDIDKIVELYTVQKVTVKDISKMCNVDSTTIWRKLKKLNLIVKEVPKTEAEMKEQERLYMLNKRAQPLEKFKAKQVSAIWDTLVINRNSVKKPFEVLFYPYEKYVNYIESQFTEGMTWVNYGEWVIEHVKPQPFFLFEDTNEAGYKECWDLTNLKLVWLKDAQGDVVNNHLFHDDGSDVDKRKHKTYFTNSEKLKIVQEYKNINLGIEKLALKYKTGKLNIKEILEENDTYIKHKGNNCGTNITVEAKTKYKVKLMPSEGKDYVAICKTTGKIFNDYLNKTGSLSTHIKQVHGVIAPNNFEKKKYFLKHDKYWYEDYFDLKEIDLKETKKCKYCDWETVDLDNKSGMYSTHLSNIHNKSVEEYVNEFPEELDYFNTIKIIFKKREKLENPDNCVTCAICNEKMTVINYHHLKYRHNMTLQKYKAKYGNNTFAKSIHNSSKIVWETHLKHRENTFTSKPQKQIGELIAGYGFEIKMNDKKKLNGTEIDIYVPSLNLGIEYNGNFWHTEKGGKKNSSFHLNKTKLADLKGIRLIHIFEDEWLLKNDIVVSKIKQIIGKNNGIKIGARQCELKEISKVLSNKFYDTFHIQGGCNSDINIGAYYNNELVGCMSFSKSRNMTINSKTKYDYDLVRLCTNNNYIISGIASKLFNYFIKTYKPNSIISFADRRWSDINSNVYINMGFQHKGFTKPNYWYYNNNDHTNLRYHKFNFGLNALKRKGMYIGGLSEWETMQYHGWDRIWDCGLIRYVWEKI